MHSVFSQLEQRCQSGDKCRLTAPLGLKEKQETSQHIAEQQTHRAYRRKARDLRKSFKIFYRIIFPHLRRRSGTTHRSSSSKVSQRQLLLLREELVIVLGSEVKQLKTKLLAHHDSALGMGTKHLTCQQSNGPWMTNPDPPITTQGEGSNCSVTARQQVLGAVWE